VYATPNEGFIKRTLGHLSFMVSSAVLGGPRLKGADVVMASSPTFFSAISGWILAVWKNAPFVFEVRDLWPAVFVELGVLKNRWLIRALEGVEMFLYRRAAAVVTVTESFRRTLVNRGVPEKKISVITNGVDVEEFYPVPPDLDLKKALGCEGKFVVLYLGTHGISHALQTVLRAAELVKHHDDLQFVLVGEGAEKRQLMEYARVRGLDHVRFVGGQPKDRVRAFYGLADVCLVPLRDIPIFETFIPSKMFEIMACAKPIVASVRGEAREILEQSGAAVVVPPEDAEAMAQAILDLRSHARRRVEMGTRGLEFVKRHYLRSQLAKRYETTLISVVKDGS